MRTNLRLLVVLTATACLWPTDVCGCTPLGIGFLTGSVRRADASPVAGAQIHVAALVHGCSDTLNALVDDTTTIANSNGAFVHELLAYMPTDSACIRVVAFDPASPTHDSITAEGLRMRLVPNHETYVPDTLNVVLQFP